MKKTTLKTSPPSTGQQSPLSLNLMKRMGVHSLRGQFNPIRELNLASLSRSLDAFHAGELRQTALIWDAIERRDDVLQGLVSKRKKAVARLDWEVLTTQPGPEAQAHKQALEYFYNHLEATHACDQNQRGGMSLLVKQMMDAVGKRYAVHEILYQRQKAADGQERLAGIFRFVPLWFFENRNGCLGFLESDTDRVGRPLEPGQWLVTTGDGLMESSSIAYLFKHLPLRDWLVYCERNGMPGVKGTTDALPGTAEWEAARQAVADFGAEFHALMGRGTDIQPIDITSKSALPYPQLVERMDRAMAALWRGADLGTLSHAQGHGASLQQEETQLLESTDAALISETLNIQVDRFVLRESFGPVEPLAYLRLKSPDRKNRESDLALYAKLWEMGLPLAVQDIMERLGLPLPDASEALIQKPSVASPPTSA